MAQAAQVFTGTSASADQPANPAREGVSAPPNGGQVTDTGPAPELTIPMLSPDGKSGDIPFKNLDAARAAGFKVAVIMQAPDGSKGYIPAENVQAAGASGFKMVPMNVPDAAKASYWDALTNPIGIGGADQGLLGGIKQVGGQAIKTMAQPLLHPIDTLEGMGNVASDVMTQGPTAVGTDVLAPLAEQYLRDKEQGGNALALENLAGQAAGTIEGGRVMAAPVTGVDASPALGAAGEAPLAGAAGPVNAMGGLNRFIPEAVRTGVLPSAWDWVTNAAKGAITGDVNAPIAGSELTPAERYAAMQRTGVKPNAAEATNSTPLNIAEKVNQNSLTAAPTYAKARAGNLAALNDYTKDVLDKMSPAGPEEGGAAVQKGLRDAQTKLQNNAAEGFSELDRAVGSRKMAGTDIQTTAQNIYDGYKDYAAAHPALVPKEAWKIVRDLAGESNDPAFTSRPMSFPEVHQLRSDLLEMVRTNPDIVKNQAGGWLQQLAQAADRTMTTGATGLSPEGTQIFRNANEAWANMKGTFDNPSHPFYQAVRSQSPSTLLNGIQKTPEMAKMLQDALGPEGMGPIQRGIAEKALGTTKEGNYNFRTFQGQWAKLPESYRNAVFTPEQQQALGDIGNVGTVLNEDVNPSGSARLGQGIAEGAEGLRSVTSPHELAGNAAYHAAQYGLARLMNSPTFVDWLMRGRGIAPIQGVVAPDAPAMNALMPAAVASGALRSGWDFEHNRPAQ